MSLKIWLKNNSLQDVPNISCIYKITSPNNRIYIGKANEFRKRMSGHLRDSKLEIHERKPLYRSFKKYSVLNHSIEIIDIVENTLELDELEVYYIDFFKSFSGISDNFNLTKGGPGKKGIPMSEEIKRKLIEANSNRQYTEEDRIKMSQYLTGRRYKMKEGYVSPFKGIPRTQEVKDKVSKANKGRKLTAEQCAARSKATKGRESNRKGVKLSKETIDKMVQSKKFNFEQQILLGIRERIDRSKKPADSRKKYCKIVLQYDLEDNFIRETTRTELRLEGFKVEAIKRCLLGKNKTSQNFKWIYKDEN